LAKDFGWKQAGHVRQSNGNEMDYFEASDALRLALGFAGGPPQRNADVDSLRKKSCPKTSTNYEQ